MDISWREGVSWTIAVVFFLWALGLSSRAPSAGVIALAIGVVFVPRVRQELHDRFEVRFTKKSLLLILVIGVFFVSAATPNFTSQSPSAAPPAAASGDSVSASEYNELRSQYNQLQSQNDALRSNNEQLREQNDQLRSELQYSVEPPYIIAEDRSFTAAFENQGGGISSYSIDSETVEAQILTGSYMRTMTYSNMEYLGLREIYTQFEGQSKYQRLGNHGRFYQLKPFVVEENFQTVSQDIYDRYDSDEERVKEVWRYTTQMHVYSSEIEETPRMPLETLVMGGGDCEDTAILAASMLKAMPEDWTVEFVFMDSDNPTNPKEINHVLVYVDTGEYQTFIETTSSTTMTPYDEIDGYYVEV